MSIIYNLELRNKDVCVRICTVLVLLIISDHLTEPQERTFRCHRRKGQIDDPDGRSKETCYGSGFPAKTLPRWGKLRIILW